MKNKDNLKKAMSHDFARDKNYLKIEDRLRIKGFYKLRYALYGLGILLIWGGLIYNFQRELQLKNIVNPVEEIIINTVDNSFLDTIKAGKKGLPFSLENYQFIDDVCLQKGYVYRGFKEITNSEIKYLLEYQKDTIILKIYILQDDYKINNYQESKIGSKEVYLLQDKENIYANFKSNDVNLMIETIKEQEKEVLEFVRAFN